tara:strand:+ start:1112 stop:2239 length:1128 start_codon:yes stop_codon:yes gene_type:complete
MNYLDKIGALSSLQDLVSAFNPGNILLVKGKKSFEKSGAGKVIDSLKDKYNFIVFDDFETDPKIQDVKKALNLIDNISIDLIIAIGGGSVLDMSKLIKATFKQTSQIEEIVKGVSKPLDNNIPIIAIPTTAGSGSEATHFAVAYIDKTKYSVASNFLMPQAVILDSKLSVSSTKYQKSCNVLDAISQAIESSWAVGSTKESIEISFESLELSLKNYMEFINCEQANNSSQSMQRAANLAGKAINIAKTTAPHAWSYGFSTNYDIPHGHAVWLTLPKIYKIHAFSNERKINDPRGREHLDEIMNRLNNTFGIHKETEILEFFYDFLRSIQINPDFDSLLKISKTNKLSLIKSVNKQRMSNNPIYFEFKDIDNIFSI